MPRPQAEAPPPRPYIWKTVPDSRTGHQRRRDRRATIVAEMMRHSSAPASALAQSCIDELEHLNQSIAKGRRLGAWCIALIVAIAWHSF